MDIRFLAIIFLVAALMEMLAKVMRKARQREIEGEERPRSADPLAQVFKEMDLLPDIEEPLDPVRQALESGAEGPSRRVEEAAPGTVEPRGEAADPWALPTSQPRKSPDGDAGGLPVPSGKDAEPPDSRPRVDRMFEPPGPAGSPAFAVPVPASPESRAAPARDRAPRPVEVRSREFRPREAREVVPHRRVEARPDSAAAGEVPTERARGRVGGRGRAEGTWEHGVLSLGSVRGLRRLVVAREVLGPPLALRGEEPFRSR
ncbi:MAG: hypothetical protein OXQ94_04225 [Gemmatimonadota bacterium]|nr:hypothetical protein [Gemmatimonadota bacterium]MDE2870880.1 hypothetical protein [Gemmatimonadota bacterium]